MSTSFKRGHRQLISSISVGVAALMACSCVSRKSNSLVKTQATNEKLSDVYDLPQEFFNYYEIPTKHALADGTAGFIFELAPALTVPAFNDAEDFVLEATKKAFGTANNRHFTVMPYGTHRYTFVAYPTELGRQFFDKQFKVSGKAVIKNYVEVYKEKIEEALIEVSTGIILEGNKPVRKQKVLKIDFITVEESKNWKKLDNKDHVPKKGTHTVLSANIDGNGKFTSVSSKQINTKSPDWHLEFGRFREAWDALKKKQNLQGDYTGLGKGIRVGVIDTGHIPDHQEFKRTNPSHNFVEILPKANKYAEFMKDEENSIELKGPIDSFSKVGKPANPGHGAAVMGILATLPLSEETIGKRDAYTTGLIPGVTIVPVRISTSTVFKNRGGVSSAVRYLVDNGVKVISMSLGGLSGQYLDEAVQYAHKNGVIIVTAAGNGVKMVVAPGTFKTVLAAGAVRADCQVWEKSSPGYEVDVLAPGDNVWYPATYVTDVNDTGSKKRLIWSIRRGGGTSFATPYVASMAALWLQAHGGFENIVKEYKKQGVVTDTDMSFIPKAFEVTLKHYGLKFPQSMDTYDIAFKDPANCTGFNDSDDLNGKTGEGVVDALNMVNSPLVSKDYVEKNYSPNHSIWADSLNYMMNMFDQGMFRIFDASSNRSSKVPASIRKKFFNNSELTREFVLGYIENRYFGTAYNELTEPLYAMSEEEKSWQKEAILLIGKQAKGFAGLFGRDLRTFIPGNFGLKGEFRKVNKADLIFFYRALDYSVDYALEKNKVLPANEQITEADAKTLAIAAFEDLFRGNLDWKADNFGPEFNLSKED